MLRYVKIISEHVIWSFSSKITSFTVFSGQQVRVKKLQLLALLPDITNYITYEGSLTQPGCYETVTWIVLNRPIIITHEQVSVLKL